MNGVLSTQDLSVESLKKKAQAAPSMAGMDLAKKVTCAKSLGIYGRRSKPRFHVVLLDYGVKANIYRELARRGCRVTIMPATATPGKFWPKSRTA